MSTILTRLCNHLNTDCLAEPIPCGSGLDKYSSCTTARVLGYHAYTHLIYFQTSACTQPPSLLASSSPSSSLPESIEGMEPSLSLSTMSACICIASFLFSSFPLLASSFWPSCCSAVPCKHHKLEKSGIHCLPFLQTGKKYSTRKNMLVGCTFIKTASSSAYVLAPACSVVCVSACCCMSGRTSSAA